MFKLEGPHEKVGDYRSCYTIRRESDGETIAFLVSQHGFGLPWLLKPVEAPPVRYSLTLVDGVRPSTAINGLRIERLIGRDAVFKDACRILSVRGANLFPAASKVLADEALARAEAIDARNQHNATAIAATERAEQYASIMSAMQCGGGGPTVEAIEEARAMFVRRAAYHRGTVE